MSADGKAGRSKYGDELGVPGSDYYFSLAALVEMCWMDLGDVEGDHSRHDHMSTESACEFVDVTDSVLQTHDCRAMS
ncbi:Uncharacterised protein [Mycobacteroides abscessus subsp. abscessus]|nr:Uncharacterised protein [Mycobacteroides abscessus subsp. abscessus]